MLSGGLRRRALLAAAATGTLAACGRKAGTVRPPGADDAAPAPASWVGPDPQRGHRLREPPIEPWPQAQVRRAAVLIVGAGIAGLAAARAFARLGVDDVQLLELDDAPGGNARGHALGGMACPLGAHYLPLPAPESVEVAEWLHEIGLLRREHGRTVADEMHLCHSPQERLFVDGRWVEGLLAPAEPGSPRLTQYRRFAALVAAASRPQGGKRAFALPASRSAWTAELAALDTETFATWLARQRLDEPALLAYLDYCCRDDYGAGIDVVSAWAGLHYFASRHGFAAPGEPENERDAVFTWPEGNAWLVKRLAAPFADRIHTGRTVLAVREDRHDVQVLTIDAASAQHERWVAGTVVLAVPLHVARRLVDRPLPALVAAANAVAHAPWLVANLQLARPLLDRPGAPPSWDNVIQRPPGSSSLGYVDAMHQSLRPVPGPTVLTAYHALPAAERPALLAPDPRPWAERVLADLETAHPDLRRRVERIALTRWGHAMAIPRPGVQRHPALEALRRAGRRGGAPGRLRFAHSDLAGYSVFEEAFTLGTEAAGA